MRSDRFPPTSLYLSGLSAVTLSIGCIGLVPQGTVVPPFVHLRPEPVPVSPPELRGPQSQLADA